MLSGATASPMLQFRAPFIKEMPEKAGFDCNMLQKDLKLALAMGQKFGVPLPTTAISNEWLNAARGQGLAHHDFAVLYYVLCRAAGLDGQPPSAKPAGTVPQ
jgi:3-hydroxyisobutyrate dehydrogenase-like beta-hydroxyacid dehydrogenase